MATVGWCKFFITASELDDLLDADDYTAQVATEAGETQS